MSLAISLAMPASDGAACCVTGLMMLVIPAMAAHRCAIHAISTISRALLISGVIAAGAHPGTPGYRYR